MTFYLTGDSSYIDIKSAAVVTIKAPTSGTTRSKPHGDGAAIPPPAMTKDAPLTKTSPRLRPSPAIPNPDAAVACTAAAYRDQGDEGDEGPRIEPLAQGVDIGHIFIRQVKGRVEGFGALDQAELRWNAPAYSLPFMNGETTDGTGHRSRLRRRLIEGGGEALLDREDVEGGIDFELR